MEWWVYLVRCRDNSLYCGITTDVDRRVHEHNHMLTGAAYTKARRPVELVWREPAASRAEASRREYAIKQLSKEAKEALVISGKGAPEEAPSPQIVIVTYKFDAPACLDDNLQTLWRTLDLVKSLDHTPRLWKLSAPYMDSACSFTQLCHDDLAVGMLWDIHVDLTTGLPGLITDAQHFPVLKL